jgi:hypothetical protein
MNIIKVELKEGKRFVLFKEEDFINCVDSKESGSELYVKDISSCSGTISFKIKKTASELYDRMFLV